MEFKIVRFRDTLLPVTSSWPLLVLSYRKVHIVGKMLIDIAIETELEIILRGANGMYVATDSSARSIFVSEKDNAEKFTVYMVDSSTIQLYSKRILKYVTRWADFVAPRKAISDNFCNFKIGEINNG